MSSLPRELWVFIVSAMPVGELRAGIPLGLGFHLDPRVVFVLAVLGNLSPVVPILILLEPASKWLMARSEFFQRTLTHLFDKTRAQHSERIEKYGAVGLAIFVAIPSPGTGAWSGCLAAWLFGIHPRYAIPAIAAGVFGAGVLVMAASTGALAIFQYLQNPVFSIGLFVAVAGIIFVVMRSRNQGGAGDGDQ